MEIKSPVGERKRTTRGASVKNVKSDVKLVQQLLVANGIEVSVNGRCTAALIAAIRSFQSSTIGMKKPDGVVDPGGRTWRAGVAKLEAKLRADPNTQQGDSEVTDYVICVRRVNKKNKFEAESNETDSDTESDNTGSTLFLEVPSTAHDITPDHKNKDKAAWTKKVLKEAESKDHTTHTDNPCGDILVYVHGFNTETKVMLQRHRKIKKHLKAAGFKGVVVSFDWELYTC